MSQPHDSSATSRAVNLAVIVAALGYLVDIYDLILFLVVRTPSLKTIGVTDAQMLSVGTSVLNFQMFGMLLGGILWGVLGDRRGRLSVLFGSIILYSLANIANGFVQTVDQYRWLRLIAGIGLAGELGAGISLVSESIDKARRGYATAIVAGVGILGGLIAVGVSKIATWQSAYFIGGGMGLALLVLRIGVYESGLYKKTVSQGVTRGNFFALFSDRVRFGRYFCLILTGLPIWYFVGIVAGFSDKLGAALGMTTPPVSADAIFWSYVGLAAGDFGSGAISQLIGSRKQTLRLFIGFIAVALTLLFLVGPRSPSTYYACCALAGFGSGYWAVFVTIASEQFGTNLRATATTTVPNFVRGFVPILTGSLKALTATHGLVTAAIIVGSVTVVVALLAVFGLEETHGKDLDFVEK